MPLPKAQSLLGAAEELFTFPQFSEISSHHPPPGSQGNGEIHEGSEKTLSFRLPFCETCWLQNGANPRENM